MSNRQKIIEWIKQMRETDQQYGSSQPLCKCLLGNSWLAENMICFYMDEVPVDILFVSTTQTLLERWASRHLEPAIDSCGFRNDLQSTNSNSSSRKTGDTYYSKEYHGCRLDMAKCLKAVEILVNRRSRDE